MIRPLHIRILQDRDLAANLLSLPLLHALHRSHPRSRLCLDVSPSRRDLFAAAGLPLEFAVDPGPSGTAVLDLRIPRGLTADGGAASPAVRPPDGPRSIPLWRQYLALTEPCGLGPHAAPEPPYLFPSRLPVPSMPPRVLLAVDTSDQEGRWTRDRWAGLERILRAQGIEIGVHEIDGEVRSLEAATLAAGASLLISSHLALLCLAAAVGTPVIGLLSLADEPKFFEPFGRTGTLLVPFEKPLADLSPSEVAGSAIDHLTGPSAAWQARQRLVLVL